MSTVSCAAYGMGSPISCCYYAIPLASRKFISARSRHTQIIFPTDPNTSLGTRVCRTFICPARNSGCEVKQCILLGNTTALSHLRGAGSHAWQYTQTSKELTQGREAAAVRSAAGAGAAVLLGAGNQAMLCAEDTLYMLFDKNLPVLLKHHPAQVHSQKVLFLMVLAREECSRCVFY